MEDLTKHKRPALPSSSTDFALPASSSSSGPSNEEMNILHQRFRRPSLLAPKYVSETRLHSPLALSVFDLYPGSGSLAKRRGTPVQTRLGNGEESDREAMWTDTSSPSQMSSADRTPPQMELDPGNDHPPQALNAGERPESSRSGAGRSKRRAPSTPPPKSRPLDQSSVYSAAVPPEITPLSMKRRSLPLKTPRVLRLLNENKPEDDEVKSEAAFQQLISSLPMQPKTPSDRGRHPTDFGLEGYQREDTPSDDGEEEAIFAFNPTPTASDSIAIRPHPRSGRATPSTLGDDFVPESPVISAMDVDSVVSVSPSFSSMSSMAHSWRYTPPPTSSAVRSNKRKLEDRFDPYPSAKRRAVSPSVAHLRDSSSMPHSPRALHPSRGMPLPISIPQSAASSTASSPTISTQHLPCSHSHGHGNYGQGYSSHNGSGRPSPMPMTPSTICASPTMRASMGLASPILRPVARMRWGPGDEREVDGAGDGVNGLSLAG